MPFSSAHLVSSTKTCWGSHNSPSKCVLETFLGCFAPVGKDKTGTEPPCSSGNFSNCPELMSHGPQHAAQMPASDSQVAQCNHPSDPAFSLKPPCLPWAQSQQHTQYLAVAACVENCTHHETALLESYTSFIRTTFQDRHKVGTQ